MEITPRQFDMPKMPFLYLSWEILICKPPLQELGLIMDHYLEVKDKPLLMVSNSQEVE